MADKTDILVLGATGYTGGLITRYLSAHPQRSQFSLAIGARSPQKLKELVQQLSLPSSVKIIQVDVTNPDEIDAAVSQTRVVINTVGPYWLWGTPVVRACVRRGIHYVDLTGEAAWIKKIIIEFDYFATKTGSIVVPSCGFDSVPSDISAFLANKTLKSVGPSSTGEYLTVGPSTSGFRFRCGISGGTIASAMVSLDKIPKRIARESRQAYVLSPFIGLRPTFRFLYNLPIPNAKTLKGAIFFMASLNRAIVQRTFGLLELEARTSPCHLLSYGSTFCYDEFMVTSGTVSALLFTAVLVVGYSMMLVKPIRAIVEKFLPQSGDGPTDENMQKGFFHVTNITSSASSPPVQVKTVVKGKGDPGYLLSASKSYLHSALDYVPNVHALPPLAQQGGVLTPMTAFGDALLQRLEESGRFEFSSSIIGDAGARKQV
ncbi:Saccharopine dehydrogenase-domain-containing protein [Flammula alnicola]|nr:Saccharopine dehydrogenase-domain-containing protein [Flammula alnicola]